MKARKEMFITKFGEKQLSLRQMATLPGYRRRGAASTLLKWGMDRARKEGIALSMFAGNMGKLLYIKFGFKELGRVKIQVPGNDEVIYEIAMGKSSTLGGYSTVFLAHASPTTRQPVTSVESVLLHVKLARENLEMAGLSDRVEVIEGYGAEVLPALVEASFA
ncbi:hypothetical protein QQZ08_010553 [Neonectria magnoliae]|uniref:N-acetyltransferase domain-containing protein n=1 Tax=Neonectria magnoliae TaxID=2732573 RepID=A0ABR1HH20_9HYPO